MYWFVSVTSDGMRAAKSSFDTRPIWLGSSSVYMRSPTASISAREIVREAKAGAPGAAQLLLSTLTQTSPRNHSESKSLK